MRFDVGTLFSARAIREIKMLVHLQRAILTLLHSFLVQVSDMSLEDYVAVKPKYAVVVPHTAGRYQTKRFRKAQCPIVER